MPPTNFALSDLLAAFAGQLCLQNRSHAQPGWRDRRELSVLAGGPRPQPKLQVCPEGVLPLGVEHQANDQEVRARK